jgi:hypothetical protein
MKRLIGALLVLVAGCSLLPDSRGPITVGSSRDLSSWPMTKTEEVAFDGLHARSVMLDHAIAEITTDRDARRKIVEVAISARMFQATQDEFFAEVRASRGIARDVALVNSGASWVLAPLR